MTPDQHQSTVDAPTAEWDDALLFDVAVDPFQRIASSGKEEGRAAGLRDGYLEGVNIGRSKGWEIGLELGYIHDIVQSILDGYQASIIRSSQPSSREQKVGDAGDTLSAQIIPEQRRTSHRLDRCLTLARDLVKMVNEFPDPDTLLAHDQESNIISKNELEEDSDGNADNNACCSTNNNACTRGAANNAQGDVNSNGANAITLEDEDASSASVPSANQAAMVDITTSIERIRAKFKLLCVLLKTKQSFDLKRILDSGTKMQQITDDVDGLRIDQQDRAVTPIKQEVGQSDHGQSDDRVGTMDKVGKSPGTQRKNVGPRSPNTEVDSDVFDTDW